MKKSYSDLLLDPCISNLASLHCAHFSGARHRRICSCLVIFDSAR
ncbi:SEPT9 isoform 3 [Pan troglodytes]|uniref:SEPT9 isoform 3 n=1 Tax=Pan troglodytes TaxID=9598 RepID=A0A2J8K7L8_PANTR|nr:SEPT9 isoform 3 [Pan troglodytes]